MGALAVILPDANIWIFYLDEAFDPEHERVSVWMEEWMAKSRVLVPAIVETEVFHYLARQLDAKAAEGAIRRFLAHPGEVITLGPTINRNAASLLLSQPDRGIGGRDATILVAAKRHDATLITHDQALFRVAIDWGLDAHDPAVREKTTGSDL